MDPPEPIHGVIGVDRALGLWVTVGKLPLMSCWEATFPTIQILRKPSEECACLTAQHFITLSGILSKGIM